MTTSYIQLPADSTGKKLRTYRITEGGIDYELEPAVLVDSAGTEVDFAALIALETIATGGSVSGSGDQTLLTPAPGMALRLYYLQAGVPASAADVDVILKFDTGGSTRYSFPLAAGGNWARNIGAGRRYVQGGVDEPLVANLSVSTTLLYSVEYEEV